MDTDERFLKRVDSIAAGWQRHSNVMFVAGLYIGFVVGLIVANWP